MKLDFSESEILLQNTASRFFAEQSTMERVRRAEGTGGLDCQLWQSVCELGLSAMRAGSAGGTAASLFEAALVAEQAGRYLASVPLVEAMVSAALVDRVNGDKTIRQDEAITTLALRPFEEGSRQLVPAGAVAERVLVLHGETLFAVMLASRGSGGALPAGLTAVAIDFGSNSGERTIVAQGPAARDAYLAAVEEWRLLNAARLTGMARRAMELATDYSNERIQFGRPIGAFQAIAHPMADHVTRVDGARLLVHKAIWAISEGHSDAAALAAMANWWAVAVSVPAVHHAVRTFGGYGVSLEYDVQLYFRRARALSLVDGAPDEALKRVAQRLYDGAFVPMPPVGDIGIDFGLGSDAEAYAAEVRDFVEKNITPDVAAKRHHSTSGFHADFHRKLAAAGHAFPDFPGDDGTLPRSRYAAMAAAAIWEEIDWTRVPTVLTDMVARLCQKWSHPEAKAEILPRLLAGEAVASLGYSEPASGSDVFGTRFSAKQDGDEWVLNGTKMFTTNAQNADYIIMLTRTSEESSKHLGLTMFIMPMKVPGVEVQAVYTLQDERTNIVYFSDVRVRDIYRVGEIGGGTQVMASALELEHGGADYHYTQLAMMKHANAWAQRSTESGRPLNNPAVRHALARAATHTAVADALCRRALWGAVEKTYQLSWGPMAKLFSTEMLYSDAQALVEVAAPASLTGEDADLAMIELTMRRAVAMTIYGGTSEVHRSLIAEKALGMPRSRQ